MLKKAEDFSLSLSANIDIIARNGGKIELPVQGLGPTSLGLLSSDEIDIFIETQESFYDKGIDIPLQDMDCSSDHGIWGQDKYSILCIKSDQLDDENVRTKYAIKSLR